MTRPRCLVLPIHFSAESSASASLETRRVVLLGSIPDPGCAPDTPCTRATTRLLRFLWDTTCEPHIYRRDLASTSIADTLVRVALEVHQVRKLRHPWVRRVGRLLSPTRTQRCAAAAWSADLSAANENRLRLVVRGAAKSIGNMVCFTSELSTA